MAAAGLIALPIGAVVGGELSGLQPAFAGAFAGGGSFADLVCPMSGAGPGMTGNGSRPRKKGKKIEVQPKSKTVEIDGVRYGEKSTKGTLRLFQRMKDVRDKIVTDPEEMAVIEIEFQGYLSGLHGRKPDSRPEGESTPARAFLDSIRSGGTSVPSGASSPNDVADMVLRHALAAHYHLNRSLRSSTPCSKPAPTLQIR